MAKNKKAKEKKSEAPGYVYELIGIAIFIMVLIMLGQMGALGQFFRRITVSLFGEFFWFVGFIIISFSFQMVAGRKKPKVFSPKYLGVYMVFTAMILFAHFPVHLAFQVEGLNFQRGIGAFFLQPDILSDYALRGGGMYGATIFFLLDPLISRFGILLVAIILVVYGGLLMAGTTIKELLDKRKPGTMKAKFSGVWTFIAGKVQLPKGVLTTQSKKLKAKRLETKKAPPAPLPSLRLDTGAKPKAKPKGKAEAAAPLPTFQITDFAENLAREMEQKEPPISNDVNYVLPPMSLLLNHSTGSDTTKRNEAAIAQGIKLAETFGHFNVDAVVSNVLIGPSVTRYEVSPQAGVKVSRITGLVDDIALALAVKGVRMEAPIPGKSAVGIEVPNRVTEMVSFKEMMDEMPETGASKDLIIGLGRDISGSGKFAALNKMPHVLVAGATGSGKSVCINTMICSLLMRFSPNEVKLLLVDPKKVELARYNGLPHLLAPVVTDPQLASAALKKVVSEMERRYDLFQEAIVRDIESYNEWVVKEKAKRESEGIISTLKKLPFVVVILDELADLMMVASREVEDSIMRLTQMARAAGIHLVVATQRPSVDVITGVIKSNIPSRIAFAVSSGTDSRTILDTVGAEKLLGRGDMLFLPMGDNAASRVQGAFITDDEVNRIVSFIKGQEFGEVAAADFLADVTVGGSQPGMSSEDPLYRDVVAFAVELGREDKYISTSLVQRRFKVGYGRGANLIESLANDGYVGEPVAGKGRPVILDEETYRELIS